MANYYEAYDDGHADGVKEGFKSGAAEGYTKGHAEGAQSGYAKGVVSGYVKGHTEGAASGYAAGVASGRHLPASGRPTIHLDAHSLDGIFTPFVLWDTSDNSDPFYAAPGSDVVESAFENVDRVEMPNLTAVGSRMFKYIGGAVASGPITFNLPKVTSVEFSGFYGVGNESLSPTIDVLLPACTRIDSAAFENPVGGSISLSGMETDTDSLGRPVLPIDVTAFGHVPSGTGAPVFTRWDLTIPGVPLAAVENSTLRSGAIEGHVFGLAVGSTITCSDGVYTVQ